MSIKHDARWKVIWPLSIGVLMAGVVFQITFYVNLGIDVMNIWLPLYQWLTYSYYLGIMLVLGALIVTGMRLLRLRLEKRRVATPA
jgi:hypothetical protein